MAAQALDVWMNGEHVGTWSSTRAGGSSFLYVPSWLESEHVRPLSLSLPIPSAGQVLRGPVVESYFDNLLPDSDHIRRRIRQRFKVSTDQTIDLLAAIGRDCVGAVQLLPPGAPAPVPAAIESEPLDEAGVERALQAVTSPTLAGGDEDDLRISIAGAQEKTALLRIGGKWHKPHGVTPTTHILKLPLGLVGNMRADMTSSVENEWLCAQILGGLGFPVAVTQIGRFGSQKALVVERFDRAWTGNRKAIVRLPQEDLCQALGVPMRSKYESEGGPGIRKILALLSGSERSAEDRLGFALSQLAFWLLAATDGHAKNFSIFLLPEGKFQSTPMYDVISMWPIIGAGPNRVPASRVKLAMALRSKNVHYHLREIQPRHLAVLASQTGVRGAFEAMQLMLHAVPDALDSVESKLPGDFPARVWESVRAGMLAQAARLRD